MPDLVDTPEPLLTVAEVATWLRVDPRYVYRLASSGDLTRSYVGRYVRFSVESVQAYIDAHTIEAAPKAQRSARPRRPGARRSKYLRTVRNAEQ
jgi:excisionase family DNA binding protein